MPSNSTSSSPDEEADGLLNMPPREVRQVYGSSCEKRELQTKNARGARRVNPRLLTAAAPPCACEAMRDIFVPVRETPFNQASSRMERVSERWIV